MTDENRAELRRGIEELARAGVVASSVSASGLRYGYKDRMAVDVFVYWPDTATLPELTTAQQLALSVLLGEPDEATTAALCDLLIEQGHEYAVAVANKARAEEREQSAIAAMTLTHDRAEQLRALPLYEMEAVALDDHADWLRDRMMERA